MMAQIQESRAKVVEAEAEVPKAIAEAFRTGKLGDHGLLQAAQRPGRHRHAGRHRHRCRRSTRNEHPRVAPDRIPAARSPSSRPASRRAARPPAAGAGPRRRGRGPAASLDAGGRAEVEAAGATELVVPARCAAASSDRRDVAQHVDTSGIRRRTRRSWSAKLVPSATIKSITGSVGCKHDHSITRRPADGRHAAEPAWRHLAAVPSPPPAKSPHLLRSPANIRQAIVLNEILTRPEHRW